MEVILRGVRGSIADPSTATSYYGGNTACIEVHTSDGSLVIFDAGSGIRVIGDLLPESGECHLFLSHAHLDHILGLPFFRPMHLPNWTTHLYLPEWLVGFPDSFLDGGTFPIPFRAFPGNILRHQVAPGQSFTLGQGPDAPVVEAMETNHPDRALAYRMRADGAVFLYGGDHEITDAPQIREQTIEMLRGTDLAVVDATYSRKSYRKGWGHSTWEDWVELSARVGVRTLVLTHHEPGKEDRELDDLQRQVQAMTPGGGVMSVVAREGVHFTPPSSPKGVTQSSDWEQDFWKELSQYKEENAILDRILSKARGITKADAGTVFLVEGNELVFAYTHNDSLFPAGDAHKHSYTSLRLPIKTNSIAGYVAVTGQILNLANVRSLPVDVPYSFNPAVDIATGYFTQSVLTLPLHDRTGKLMGVLQLINSLDESTGKPSPFTSVMERSITRLAREAANILERSALLRSNVYSLLCMAGVHDPTETGPHAERVGAIAAELFQIWADKQGADPGLVKFEKSRIRLASMLHDIGKVGISDIILKKNSQLTDEEFSIIRSHTSLGAAVLEHCDEDLTSLARDIALHHHQKWNGKGYSGAGNEGRLVGRSIPLAARLTSVADVFDALVSPRCYKKAWTIDEALALLQREAGQAFDPVIVDCMMEMRDLLPRIYARFPDKPMDFQPV